VAGYKDLTSTKIKQKNDKDSKSKQVQKQDKTERKGNKVNNKSEGHFSEYIFILYSDVRIV
jgi:hypothetical protein